MKLRDAYNLLKNEGLIRNGFKEKNVRSNDNVGDQNTSKYRNKKNENNYSGNGYFRNYSGSNQNRGSSFSQNFNNNNIPRSSNQLANYSNGSSQRTIQSRNQNMSMEVDHIEEGEENVVSEEQLNFHITAHIDHFQ